MAHSSPNLSASLHWVQGELAQSLQRVRSLIEQRIEAPEDPLPLKQAAVELHQIRGTAAMIQCEGIAALAEEMKQAVQALLSDSKIEEEAVHAALMGAAVELADYVDALVTGMQDSVLVFQPTISELREARGKPAASDAEVFAEQPRLAGVAVTLPQEAGSLTPGHAQEAAKKFLNVFQHNLVMWIKGQDVQLALGRLGKISEQVAAASRSVSGYQLWRMTAALAEALLTRGLEDGPELKRLMGRVGAQLKLLAETGEEAVEATIGKLPYQVLFHVGRSRSQGPRVAALKQAYDLERLLPSVEKVESLRAKIRGPNSALLVRLSEEIRKDLAQIKDQIDLAVRGGGKSAFDFSTTVDKLNRVGVTLSMLGLSALQEVVQAQGRALSGLSLDSGSAAHPAWLELATALLRVEHSLDDALSRQLRRARNEGQPDEEVAPESLTGGIPSVDAQEGREALMRESLVDLARLKSAVDAFLDSGFKEKKEEAIRLLAQIEPGLQIAGSEHAAGFVAALRRYMESAAFDQVRADRSEAERFADVIAALEYYFEGLRKEAPDTDARVDRLGEYLGRMGVKPGAPQAPPAEAAEPAAPAAEAPVEPVKPPPARESADEDEVDPEIREIFVEEASEVLGQLREQMNVLQANAKDEAALREVRRGFHTLKGSGRMVGATGIGEFAFAIENMLNKCLDGAIPGSPALLDLTGEAVELVPSLVESFKARQPEVPEAEKLAQRANAVAKGEQPVAAEDEDLMATFAVDAHQRLGSVLAWVKQQDLAQTHFVLHRDVTSAFHTLRGAAALVQAGGVAQLAGELEDYLLKLAERRTPLPAGGLQLLADASTELDIWVTALESGKPVEGDVSAWHQRIAAVAATLPEPEAAEVSAAEAFALSAFDQLQAIEKQTADWSANPGDPSLVLELGSSLASLATVARGADCPPLARVAEQVAGVLPAAAPTAEFFTALGAVIEGMYTQLDDFREGSLDPDDEVLLAHARDLVADSGAAPDAVEPEVEEVEVGEVAEEVEVGEVAEEVEVGEVAEEVAEEVVDAIDLDGSGPVEDAEPAVDVGEVAAGEVVEAVDIEDGPEVGDAASDLPVDEVLEVPPVADEAGDEAVEAPAEPAAAAPAPVVDTPADPELMAIFHAEAEELLESMNQHVLTLERNPSARDALQGLARDLHTFKGGARMAGLMSMGTAAHEMESRVEKLSDGRIQPGISAVSQLRSQWEGLQVLHDRLPLGAAIPAPAPPPPPPQPPKPAVEAEPSTEAASTVEEVAAPGAAPPPPPEPPARSREALVAAGWDPELFWVPEDAHDDQAARRELARVPVERLDRMLNEAGEISIYRARIEQQYTGLTFQLAEMQQTLSRIREQLRSLDIETDAQIAARGFSAAVDEERAGYSEFDPLEMDRYTRMQELSRALSESLNDLASLRSGMDEQLSETETLLMQQGRVNTEVQRGLMGTLMVPFARQESRLQRVVRQTADDAGKRAELKFDGLHQELDRNVLERMVAPLEHLLRNSVVHGLELPTERVAAGKPQTGTILVSLRREGTQLAIDVRDDGRGLNYEAIRRTAVERGLMAADARLTDNEVAMFIFEAGFSTAKELTQTAGRGVGMDVVASEVKQLGGTLELSSEPGKGARFVIRLPLTLAMSQVLLVSVAQEIYAVPLTTLEGIARLPTAQLADYLKEDGPRYHYGGQDYGVRPLAGLIDAPALEVPPDAKTVPAVLIRLGEGITGADRRVAVVVDSLLGNREIVSKAVGPQVSAVQGISGGTILPDGRVVLILDMPALLTNRARRAAVVQAAQETVVVEAPADTRQTIMVVDDSITIRKVTERLLVKHDFRVVTAKDGLDAMGQLQTELPAVILLDIEMPRADGFEVAGFVRNNERIKDVPIIMITSRSGEKHRERARQIGVNRYVIKPYQEEQLMAELRAVMGGEVS